MPIKRGKIIHIAFNYLELNKANLAELLEYHRLEDFKANAEKDLPIVGIDGLLIISSGLDIDNNSINNTSKVNRVSQYNETIPLTEYGLHINKLDHTNQNCQIKDAIISDYI